MPIEQQLSLLNDCLNSLSKIKTEQPKLMNMINNTFSGNSKILSQESFKLF